jgi:hypothetical protein
MDGKELPVSGPYNPFLSNREINRLSFNGAEGHMNRLYDNVPISEDERKLYSQWGEALKDPQTSNQNKGGKSKRRRQNKSKRRRRRSRRQRKA